MSSDEVYDRARVFLDEGAIDWMGDGVGGQLICLEISDQTGIGEPAYLALWPAQARELANRLLIVAEHAERISRYPGPATT
ncbi:MAG TPA: hypothetical protein VEF89_30895 [Solirubrobacteraceae bacterium]|nr:hypothetical protein [Solirubrobacteraceae bacterium]